MAKPAFRSKNATGLLRDAENIFLKMTENAEVFASPVPDLTTFGDLLSAYREAYAEATFRDKRAVVIKGQRGQNLQEAIYRLSHYVYAISAGDPAIILAAGFRIVKEKSGTVLHTPKAENLRVEHIQVGSGTVRLRVDAWTPARLYRYEYRQKGEQAWEGVLHSKSSIELGNLNNMQEYEFRVSYIGRDTVLNFSDTVTALVV